MTTTPADPAIYHITHLANLPSILAAGGLLSDAARRGGQFTAKNIGHMHIKARRMSRTVPVAAKGVLGDYVPFNFCSRSVMLCAVANGHQDYAGGDSEVLHLVSSVQTAAAIGKPWAFTDRHAELAYTQFFDDLADLHHVPWHVMSLTWWSQVREERQAEFLVHGFFPWTSVTHIVVKSQAVAARVSSTLATSGVDHVPPVAVDQGWYY